MRKLTHILAASALIAGGIASLASDSHAQNQGSQPSSETFSQELKNKEVIMNDLNNYREIAQKSSPDSVIYRKLANGMPIGQLMYYNGKDCPEITAIAPLIGIQVRGNMQIPIFGLPLVLYTNKGSNRNFDTENDGDTMIRLTSSGYVLEQHAEDQARYCKSLNPNQKAPSIEAHKSLRYATFASYTALQPSIG